MNFKKYYYNNYRGFRNEFTIISVDMTNEKEVKAFEKYRECYMNSNNTNWDLHQITAKRAREIIAHERALKRDYIKAGLNLVNNPVGATEIITATEFFKEY